MIAFWTDIVLPAILIAGSLLAIGAVTVGIGLVFGYIAFRLSNWSEAKRRSRDAAPVGPRRSGLACLISP